MPTKHTSAKTFIYMVCLVSLTFLLEFGGGKRKTAKEFPLHKKLWSRYCVLVTSQTIMYLKNICFYFMFMDVLPSCLCTIFM